MTISRKHVIVAVAAVLVLASAAYMGIRHPGGQWKGVDEDVVEKFAEQAGRPAHRPMIDTDRGDLLLFVFLLGGATGGFVLGYYYRTLLGAKEEGRRNAPDA